MESLSGKATQLHKQNYIIKLDPEEIGPHFAVWIRVSQYEGSNKQYCLCDN